LCDNKAAVSLCSDRKETKHAKHIDIVHHFARDRVASGELKFVYCKSEENASDCLTKALPRPLLEMSLRGLDVVSLKCIFLPSTGECQNACGLVLR
jgi:hypothetical protein